MGERRKQSHCLTVYLANWLKHGAAGSPARWKQHVNQTILRNRGIMIFQNLKTHCFTFIISTPCVVVHLFQITILKKKIVLFPMIVGGDNFPPRDLRLWVHISQRSMECLHTCESKSSTISPYCVCNIFFTVFIVKHLMEALLLYLLFLREVI